MSLASELSEYEQQRLKNIEKNMAMLLSLDLAADKARLNATPAGGARLAVPQPRKARRGQRGDPRWSPRLAGRPAVERSLDDVGSPASPSQAPNPCPGSGRSTCNGISL